MSELLEALWPLEAPGNRSALPLRGAGAGPKHPKHPTQPLSLQRALGGQPCHLCELRAGYDDGSEWLRAERRWQRSIAMICQLDQ